MTGRFASSSASSSLLLLLVFVVATFLALAAATGFEVDPEKVVFFDGAVGINETTDPDHSATTRIVGGDVANESRYPYYTALFDFIPAVGGLVYHGCGGSLIRDDVVITAAHCVQDLSSDYTDLRAIVNFTSYDDLRYAQVKTVTKFVINQNYDDLYVLNDVALLFLDSPVMGVTPITLNTDPDIPSDGEILEAIGFGATDGNLTKIPVKLLQVDLPKVNDDTCENLWTVYVDTKTQICAGGRPEGGKSTCGGDSGGPLFAPGATPEDDVLLGLTSYGPLYCSEAGIPVVFTRVSQFANWIKESLSCVDADTCTSSPTISPTVTPTPPPPQYLPGPTANIVVELLTDSYPQESILGYQNVCSGKTNLLFYYGSDLLPNEEFNFPVVLSPGIYKFFLADAYVNGIVRYGGGTWSVIAAGNIVLYQNDGFMGGVVDTTGIIIVGNELVCPDVLLPGSTAFVIVTLFTDSFPEETSLGYQNLCNNIETTILEYNDTSAENRTQHSFPLVLSDGEYAFSIADSFGNGLYDGSWLGNWSVLIADENVILYENIIFIGSKDNSGSPLVVGGGCRGNNSVSTITVPTIKPSTKSPAPSYTSAPSLNPQAGVVVPSTNNKPTMFPSSMRIISSSPSLRVVLSSGVTRRQKLAQSTALLWITAIIVTFL